MSSGVRLTDEELEGKVVAGVDTHADTHWLCVLDGRGRVALSREFDATAEGCAELARAIGGAGGCAAVGVEGTCSYGAQLTDELVACGYRVLEVLRPKRPPRGAEAEEAAQEAGRGQGRRPRRARRRGHLRAQAARRLGRGPEGPAQRAREVRRGLRVRAQRGAGRGALRPRGGEAQVGGPVAGGDDEGVRGAPGAGRDARGKGAAGPRAPERDATPVERALLALGRTWEAARAEADALEGAMEAMVAANLPSLAAVPNCGAVSAAKLVVAAGENPGRLRSEGAFAMLCGAAPVPASSGKTDRFRLNRGGDRRANNALHMIVAGRMRSDPRTAEYVERRRAEGKSTREIMRCLKRYVAREVYRALTRPGDAPAPPDPAALRAARRSAGLSQRQVAEALGRVGRRARRVVQQARGREVRQVGGGRHAHGRRGRLGIARFPKLTIAIHRSVYNRSTKGVFGNGVFLWWPEDTSGGAVTRTFSALGDLAACTPQQVRG